jgi:hypothetical protein
MPWERNAIEVSLCGPVLYRPFFFFSFLLFCSPRPLLRGLVLAPGPVSGAGTHAGTGPCCHGPWGCSHAYCHGPWGCSHASTGLLLARLPGLVCDRNVSLPPLAELRSNDHVITLTEFTPRQSVKKKSRYPLVCDQMESRFFIVLIWPCRPGPLGALSSLSAG